VTTQHVSLTAMFIPGQKQTVTMKQMRSYYASASTTFNVRNYTPPGSNNADSDKLSFQHFSSSWQTHSVKL